MEWKIRLSICNRCILINLGLHATERHCQNPVVRHAFVFGVTGGFISFDSEGNGSWGNSCNIARMRQERNVSHFPDLRKDWRTRDNLFSIGGKYGIFIWRWMKIVCHFSQHLTAVIWFGGNGKWTGLRVTKAQMSESKADRLAPWFGVLGWTPFDLFLYWRIRFPSPSTSPGCDNLSAWRCTLKGPGTSCLCVAGHKSPRVFSASLSSLAISGKASQFFGDTSLVGVRISVGGHRSVGGGSDKLWNVKDQFLPHVSAVGEHSRAVS